MKVTEKDYDFMVECQERDIATILVEGKNMTIHQALDTLYNSKPMRCFTILKQDFSSNPQNTCIRF